MFTPARVATWPIFMFPPSAGLETLKSGPWSRVKTPFPDRVVGAVTHALDKISAKLGSIEVCYGINGDHIRNGKSPAHLGEARSQVRPGHRVLREGALLRRASMGMLAGARRRARDRRGNRSEPRALPARRPP